MIIIGFDPGIEKCGYGVIEIINNKPVYIASGSLTSIPSQPLEQKLACLQQEIETLIEQWYIDGCAVEDLFVGPNMHSSLRLGMAHGVILATLGNRQLPTVLYTPAMIKKTIAGNGRATKDTVARMVQKQLGIVGSFSPDSTDALAVALCHFYRIDLD